MRRARPTVKDAIAASRKEYATKGRRRAFTDGTTLPNDAYDRLELMAEAALRERMPRELYIAEAMEDPVYIGHEVTELQAKAVWRRVQRKWEKRIRARDVETEREAQLQRLHRDANSLRALGKFGQAAHVEELISKLLGTQEAIKIDVKGVEQKALVLVAQNISSEEMQRLREEYRRDRGLALPQGTTTVLPATKRAV